ncbi:hypothetical protein FRC12_005746 [Ceratobasidium sp. 428]|nr:hypothetical protein FRC12_005746 [Ceratobasidium sp. 428]
MEKMDANKQKLYFEYYLDSLLDAMREVDDNNQPVMSYRKRTTTLVNKWFEYCYKPKPSNLPPKKRTRRVYEPDDEEAYITSIAVADEDSEVEAARPAQPARRPAQPACRLAQPARKPAARNANSQRESPPQAGPSNWRSYRKKHLIESDEDSN